MSSQKTIQLNNVLLSKDSSILEIETWLVQKVSQHLKMEATVISITAELATYGLDSMDAVMISGELEDALEVELPSTILWDYPTIESLSKYLFELINK